MTLMSGKSETLNNQDYEILYIGEVFYIILLIDPITDYSRARNSFGQKCNMRMKFCFQLKNMWELLLFLVVKMHGNLFCFNLENVRKLVFLLFSKLRGKIYFAR